MMRSRRGRLWGIAGAAALAVAALVFYLVGSPGAGRDARADAPAAAAGDSALAAGEEPAGSAVPVEVARAARRQVAAYYRAASVVEADRLVEVTARVGGRVRSLAVEEGDWVEAGQVLAELENDRERVGLRQAELRLAEQERLLSRYEAMGREGLISEQEHEDAVSARDLAAAERDLAEIALRETVVRAPFAGQVTARRIVPGQQVSPAEPLLTIADFAPLRVRVHLPEPVARKIAAGQRVLVYPEASETAVEAAVERVAPVVDPETGTLQVTLRLAGEDPDVRVGGFVRVRVTTDRREEALAVPRAAVLQEGSLRSVFVVEADTVRKSEVRTGLQDEVQVEILEGLGEGDFVVTLGQGSLRPGTRVEVLNAAEVGWGARPQEPHGAGADQVALGRNH